MLGCGESTAVIYDRGGVTRLGQLDGVTLLRYGRIRDDISTCDVTLSMKSARCAPWLAEKVSTGRHEIVVFRNGQRVWEGPIIRIGWFANKIELAAHDVMHYAYRTVNHGLYDYTYPKTGYATAYAARLLRTELARKEAIKPSINVVPHIMSIEKTTDARTTRKLLPYQKSVYGEIDDMATNSGIDYTVIGRRILVWDTNEVIGRTHPLSHNDFLGDVAATEYGMDLATRAFVTDNQGAYGSYGTTSDPYYGEIERIDSAYSENDDSSDSTLDNVNYRKKNLDYAKSRLASSQQKLALDPSDAAKKSQVKLDQQVVDQAQTDYNVAWSSYQARLASLRDQAQRNMYGRLPSPVVVRVVDNSQMSPKAMVDFNDLVPGVQIPLQATLGPKSLQQMQKLDSVTVEQSADSGSEKITVVMSPFPGVLPIDTELESDGT